LDQYNAKATFFCVGDNIRKHPKVFTQIMQKGHQVANHTFHHLNGAKCSVEEYWQDIILCEEEMKKHGTTPKLFRPPYGRISVKQNKRISKDYTVVMWDVLSGDFMSDRTANQVLKTSIKHTQRGSIVLFHDSIKTIEKLKEVLPQYLDHFSAEGYAFKSLPS
jgi:peptidoglycan/xylan/chitin deacetylase (PgdA/CDA1 family)